MLKTVCAILTLAFLTGCAGMQSMEKLIDSKDSPGLQVSPIKDRMMNVRPIDGPKITIAVYQFADKTGQRKPADNIANLSSAVTQGSEVWVIKALQEVGNGTWFEVVERVGMDHLIKERQLIRNTRDVYEKDLPNGPTPLKPMLFAGLLLEGGIVGYDSNVAVGGIGARYLGIGNSIQYREDTVTLSLRMVSVSTGEVLLEILSQKTIFSYGKSEDVFRFIEAGTELVEIELGNARNESSTIALMKAIEGAVLEIVNLGYDKGYWVLQNEEKTIESKNDE